MLCFNFVSKLLECVQNRCWKNVRHAKMWSIHHSVVFLRIRWSYYGIYATVSGIFFSMMNYQIWQQLLGHSFTFVYSWQLCSFRLRVTRHLAYALALNLDLFQMSLPYLLFLKCLVARRCISCDLLQPYFHCFSYSLVPSFALKQLSRLAFKNCRREAAAELSKPFFLG